MKDKIVFYSSPYENYYVSKDGEIYSDISKKVLTPKIDKDGYCEYGLTINGQLKYVRGHRIIAETFLSNPNNKPTVNHKNGIKDDNRLINLEWSTYSENNLHRFRVLHTATAEQWLIDIYSDNELYDTGCNLADCIRAGVSGTYLRCIRDSKVNTYFMFFEKMENNNIYVWWNGNVIYRFDNAKHAAEELNMKLNCVYTRAKKHKELEYITREYTFVFRSKGKGKCND